MKYDDSKEDHLTCQVELTQDTNVTKDLEQLANGLVKKFEKLQILSKKDFNDGANSLKNITNPIQIANNLSSNLNISIFEKQNLLEIIDLKKRLEKIHSLIEKETSVLSVEKKIRGRVKNQMEKPKENIT